MKFFLDENIPLALQTKLRNQGYECEHVITSDLRGCSDQRITEFLTKRGWTFITQDDDFFDLLVGEDVTVFLSRIPQELLIEERVARWTKAVAAYVENFSEADEDFYEITPEGDLIPIEEFES